MTCPTASQTGLRITARLSEKLQAEGRVYPCYETEAELERQRKRQMARGQAARL